MIIQPNSNHQQNLINSLYNNSANSSSYCKHRSGAGFENSAFNNPLSANYTNILENAINQLTTVMQTMMNMVQGLIQQIGQLTGYGSSLNGNSSESSGISPQSKKESWFGRIFDFGKDIIKSFFS